jgi:hypothetical protein
MIVLSFSFDIDWRSSANWRRERRIYGILPAIHKWRFCALIRRFFGQRIARAAAAAFILPEEPALQQIGDSGSAHGPSRGGTIAD